MLISLVGPRFRWEDAHLFNAAAKLLEKTTAVKP